MSKTAQISNLLAVIIPFVAFIVAVVLLWGNGVGWPTSRSSGRCTWSPASA